MPPQKRFFVFSSSFFKWFPLREPPGSFPHSLADFQQDKVSSGQDHGDFRVQTQVLALENIAERPGSRTRIPTKKKGKWRC